MPLRIVRNDITLMDTQAIVNTANEDPVVGSGCDSAIYHAAGYDRLLSYRKQHIGHVPEGEVFLTPGFDLKAEYIIHAVSPLYQGGGEGEEEKLRSCYRKSLQLAGRRGIRSISFPLISTGGFGYPREEGMRIAADEINHFLLFHEMDVYLVVFDAKATQLGEKLYPELRRLIDHSYVLEKREEEYGSLGPEPDRLRPDLIVDSAEEPEIVFRRPGSPVEAVKNSIFREKSAEKFEPPAESCESPRMLVESCEEDGYDETDDGEEIDWEEDLEAVERLNAGLKERLSHMSDTFSEYLFYLIGRKGLKNPDVYKRAIIDKRYFAKIKKNKHFHPEKLKALCLCVGAKLSLDETKDLLARAGYALSPCDPVDTIFSVYIDHKCYSVIEIDILLEELGLPCIIS